MAKTVLILAPLTLMLMTLFQYTATRALPDRDLIDGNEFLSLFINSDNRNSPSKNYKEIESKDNLNEDDLMESVLSEDEDMQTENSKYDLAGRHHIKIYQKADPADEMSTTSNSIHINSSNKSEEKKEVDYLENKHIVQMVTSGSKVIFLEKLSSFDRVKNGQKLDDVSNEVRSSEEATNRKNSTEDQDVSESTFEEKNISPSGPSDIEDHFDDEEIARGAFVNRSHKTVLSADDSEPVTHGVASDTMSSQSNMQQAQQRIGSGSQIAKKQDSLLPFQTVIYHDTNYHKSMAAQPRSVSYTSIAQSIDQLNPWSNSDAFLEAKKNVSQGLQPIKHIEPISINSGMDEVFSKPEKVYSVPAKVYSEPAHVYSQPAKFYSEPAKVYSEPAKTYGKPEIQYGEPSKFYSEPSKVYSEPSKIYSEPAKIYSEPAKTYWPTTLPPAVPTSKEVTKQPNHRKVIFNLDKLPYDLLNAPHSNSKLLESGLGSLRNQSQLAVKNNSTAISPPVDDGRYYHEYVPRRTMATHRPSFKPSHFTESSEDIYTPTPEQNYEVEESVSVKTNGRAHGIQPPSPSTANPTDDSKVGYVFEGRNFRKYRVEEKTADGFIVGEYGVVSHNDGSLRGVRYTADSNINPSLIHDALMKFLSL